jgi:uncharacterized repeat protein (TIGR02543 family)
MKKTIKLTVGLLLATLFFTGCVVETGNIEAPSSEKILVNIKITKPPVQVEYFIDEPLDLDGLEVTANYSNNAKEKVLIGVKNVSGFDSSTPGTKTLAVTWKEKTDTFDITVDNITLSKVEITRLPAKTGYSMYEELDLDGLEVTATFNDKSTRELSIHELEVTGFETNKAGEKTITVSFAGTGIGAGLSDTFKVTVTAKIFTIIFDKNGGDSDANPTTKTVTQPTENIGTLPSQPVKAGYHFTGWNTKADGSGSGFFANSLVTDSFTVYAQWFKPVVTFYSNGGSEIESQDINYGTTAAEPAVPVKTGYNRKFDGWYTDAETLIDEWDFTNTVIANIELYAKWIPYEIGDTGPGGGKIFYRNEVGFTIKGATVTANETGYYLEASPSDLGSFQWGASGDDITGLGTTIGDGKRNTQLIIPFNVQAKETGRAAQVCVGYTNNALTDWFLPSKDELYQLFLNRAAAGITLLEGSTRNYWSSSYGDTNQQALVYRFNNGITDSISNRNNSANVRAIRAF